MRIRYFCHYGQLTGYGRAARDYLAALAGARINQGLTLEIVPYECVRGDGPRAPSPEPRYADLDAFVRLPHELGPADLEVHHAQPRLLAAMGPRPTWDALEVPLSSVGDGGLPCKRIALTTWETHQVPEAFVRPIDQGFHAVIVPSQFCERSFVAGGAKSKIHVVPHGFDPDFWKLPPLEREPTQAYRFYTIGAWNGRKNPAGVLKAYLCAFTRGDPVLLALFGQIDHNEVRQICAASGLPAEALPHIVCQDPGTLDESALYTAHALGDCYVSATRCEGWGLGLFEAACLGKTIISPLYGGQREFLEHWGEDGVDVDDEIIYPWCHSVDYQLTPCYGSEVRGEIARREDGTLVQKSTIAIPPGVNAKQLWAEPDLEDLAQRMFHTANHQGYRSATDADELVAFRKRFERRFGYAAVGADLATTFEEIYRS